MTTPFALIEGADPNSFSARIEAHHCVGPMDRQFLFGGAAMALTAKGIARYFDQPLRWLTLQFIAPSFLGETLHLNFERLGGGRTVQLGVRGNIDGKIVFTGLGAAGGQWQSPDIQSALAPPVAAPQDCPIIKAHDRADHDAHGLFEMRPIIGRFGLFGKEEITKDGHVHMWMKPSAGPVDTAALAMIADFLPSTTSNAVEDRAGGSSLDNTLRVIQIVPTLWVLCDFNIIAIRDGIGHGTVKLFAEDGTLMAIASQTFVVRMLPSRSASNSET